MATAPVLTAGAYAAGNSAQAAGMAVAVVADPLSAVSLEALDFGLVRSGSGQGSVDLSSAASAVYRGGARHLCIGQGSCIVPHRASFALHGEPGRAYSITVSERLMSAGEPGGAARAALVVDTIRLSADASELPGRVRILGDLGREDLRIGARLLMAAGLRAGRYRIPISVMINYP